MDKTVYEPVYIDHLCTHLSWQVSFQLHLNRMTLMAALAHHLRANP